MHADNYVRRLGVIDDFVDFMVVVSVAAATVATGQSWITAAVAEQALKSRCSPDYNGTGRGETSCPWRGCHCRPLGGHYGQQCPSNTPLAIRRIVVVRLRLHHRLHSESHLLVCLSPVNCNCNCVSGGQFTPQSSSWQPAGFWARATISSMSPDGRFWS